MKNLRGQGVFIKDNGEGLVTERTTITCAHCNRIAKKPLPGEDYGFCNKCFAPTCLRAQCNAGCKPFEKKIDEYAARMRFRANL